MDTKTVSGSGLVNVNYPLSIKEKKYVRVEIEYYNGQPISFKEYLGKEEELYTSYIFPEAVGAIVSVTSIIK